MSSSDDFFNENLGSPPTKTATAIMSKSASASLSQPRSQPPPRATPPPPPGGQSTSSMRPPSTRTARPAVSSTTRTTGTAGGRTLTSASTRSSASRPSSTTVPGGLSRPRPAGSTPTTTSSRPTTSSTRPNTRVGTSGRGTTHLARPPSQAFANTGTAAAAAASNPYGSPQQPSMFVPQQQQQQPQYFTPLASSQQQQQQQQPFTQQTGQPGFFLSGAIDANASSQQQQQPMNFFQNNSASNDSISSMQQGSTGSTTSAPSSGGIDFENEPPLLEELGINLEHIAMKVKAVILPSRRLFGTIELDPAVIVEDADLAGPLAFALLLGGELLLTGKVHFGYIYGFGLFGCLTMTLMLNLMATKPVSVWTVASVLGYSLLPVNVLAAVKILVVNIIRMETFGRFLALIAVAWSTVASTRLLEEGCDMKHQRYLLAYPLALLYSAFVLMTIF